MSNIIEKQTSLSPEDQFLLELLVDGELEEPNRRDLLLRLDRIPGGWRCCAAAFLEAQAVSESLKSKFGPNGPRPAGDASGGYDREEQTVFVSVRNIPDAPPKRGPEGISRSKETTLQNDPLEQPSGEKDADDPLIIPMDRGGFSRSKFARRMNREWSASGLSRRSFFGAMAGGFLLAVVLTGVLAGLWRAGSHPGGGRIAPVAVQQVPKQAPPAAALREAPAMAFADTQNDAVPPIRHVTLKSPQNELDGVSIPCIEADAFDPKAFRVDDNTDRYVEQLRKDGHQVETQYDELMFPLKDGRRLIVPVDTIQVRYKNAPEPILIN